MARNVSLKSIPQYIKSCSLWEESFEQIMYTYGVLDENMLRSKLKKLVECSNKDELTDQEIEMKNALETYLK